LSDVLELMKDEGWDVGEGLQDYLSWSSLFMAMQHYIEWARSQGIEVENDHRLHSELARLMKHYILVKKEGAFSKGDTENMKVLLASERYPTLRSTPVVREWFKNLFAWFEQGKLNFPILTPPGSPCAAPLLEWPGGNSRAPSPLPSPLPTTVLGDIEVGDLDTFLELHGVSEQTRVLFREQGIDGLSFQYLDEACIAELGIDCPREIANILSARCQLMELARVQCCADQHERACSDNVFSPTLAPSLPCEAPAASELLESGVPPKICAWPKIGSLQEVPVDALDDCD